MRFLVICTFLISLSSLSSVPRKNSNSLPDKLLLNQFKQVRGQDSIKILQAKVLPMAGKAVPTLVKVMKDSSFPNKARWISTFWLGKIMGKKASTFLSKFVSHPNWVLRMASLKTLLAIGDNQMGQVYAKALKDSSYVVRGQALENIKRLRLKKYSADVWNMFFDKSNYHDKNKKTELLSEVIETVAVLDYKEASPVLVKLIKDQKYKSFASDIDIALSKLNGKKSPASDLSSKIKFWGNVKL